MRGASKKLGGAAGGARQSTGLRGAWSLDDKGAWSLDDKQSVCRLTLLPHRLDPALKDVDPDIDFHESPHPERLPRELKGGGGVSQGVSSHRMHRLAAVSPSSLSPHARIARSLLTGGGGGRGVGGAAGGGRGGDSLKVLGAVPSRDSGSTGALAMLGNGAAGRVSGGWGGGGARARLTQTRTGHGLSLTSSSSSPAKRYLA